MVILHGQLSQQRLHHVIKISLMPHIKDCHALLFYETHQRFPQFGTNGSRTVSVSKKSAYLHFDTAFLTSIAVNIFPQYSIP